MSDPGSVTSVPALLRTLQPLGGQVEHLRDQARAGSPGRTAGVIDAGVGELLGTGSSLAALGALSPAEEVVVEITERFLFDAHGIDDALMSRLGEHYTPAEQVALLFHLALTDGFTRFATTFALAPEDPS